MKHDVKIVTTIDTLSHCPGIHANTAILAKLGAEFLYGAEIAHTDIPRGIDAQEIHLMLHLTGMTPLELFQTATSKAGEYLGLAPLLPPGVQRPYLNVMAAIRERQARRGHKPRTREAVDEYLQRERESWEE